MELSCAAFKNGGRIPDKYSCSGDGANPPLRISGVPPEAKSLALVMDDPDAPMGTFIHWLVWDMEPKTKEIKENAQGIGVEGITTAGEIGYIPPCPPRGSTHTYRFKLYALDVTLGLKPGAGSAQLEGAMKNHVLAMAELDGEFGR
jgi:Raf kinase inhibitor-like YbhB/YbcL family protein